MQTNFSFIIPVYNRPQEIKELLESIKNLIFEEAFEVVIIEDGSTLTFFSFPKKYPKLRAMDSR